MRILVLTRYGPLGSSSRVRFYQYYPHLAAGGIELQTVALLNDNYVRGLYSGRRPSPGSVAVSYLRRIRWLLRAGSFDLVWLEKELFPWLPALAERLLASARIPYVVDYDDAVFHNYDLHRNALVRLFLGRKIDSVMRKAALVIAGNEYLADRARAAGAPRVECLPSVVDSSRYFAKGEAASPVFRIGWIGSPVTARFLEVVRAPLEAVSTAGATTLVLIGAGAAAPLIRIPTESMAWSEADEPTLLSALDLGIMPLPDGPFVRGKCGYKLIQYMAAGLPVIASPVGVNVRIVEPGINGLLASTSEEWKVAFELLRANPQLCRRMGLAGRQKMESEYSLQVTAPRLLDLLESARR